MTIDVHTYGASETASAATNDSAFASAFGASVGTSDNVPVIAEGEFTLTGVSIPAYGKLRADNGVLIRSSGSGPLVSVASNPNGLQTTRSAQLIGMNLRCDISASRTGVGLSMANNATITLERTTVRGALTGYLFDRAQFTTVNGAKAYDNDVGMVLYASPTEGGGGDLTMLQPVLVGNKVGMLIDSTDVIYGAQAGIALVNPQFLVNTICGLAVVGHSGSVRAVVDIYGMAPEANGRSGNTEGASYSYPDGPTVPRCSIYLSNAVLNVHGAQIAEYGDTNPCFILEGGDLNLNDVIGYGGPSSTFVRADSNSAVSVSGSYGCIGECQGVVHFSGHLVRDASQGALLGPKGRRHTVVGIPNLFADPEVAIQAAPGASWHTEVTAEGRQGTVTFATDSAGSADNNCARMILATGSNDRVLAAIELTSSIDATYLVGLYPNDGNVSFSLRAGVPTLVVHWANKPVDGWSGANLWCIYPTAAGGPTLKLRWGHAIAGNFTDPNFMAAADQIAAGAYCPNTPTGTVNQPQASIPTNSVRPVGTFIANSAPTAGGTLGWVHVGSGSWKAVAVSP